MTMYFKNRDEAGRQLAEILFHPYGRSNSVILALGPGGVMVSIPIALRLQIPVFMVASKEIDLPGSFHETVGNVDQSGEFIYSSDLSTGERDEIFAEYHGHIESEKTQAIHDINQLLGAQGFVDKKSLMGKNILIVSDGLGKGSELDSIIAFLKPVSSPRLVGVCPVASVDAIDKMHIVTDEIRVLSPKDNYLGTHHYYEENDVPNDDHIQKIIQNINHPVQFDAFSIEPFEKD
jgi:predicted phosphoribosyltransferase